MRAVLRAEPARARFEEAAARVAALEVELAEARRRMALAQVEYLAESSAPREPPTLLRIPEAARRLAVSPSKLYGMISRRELPAVQVGDGSTRVAVADIEAYLADHRRAE